MKPAIFSSVGGARSMPAIALRAEGELATEHTEPIFLNAIELRSGRFAM